MNDIFMQNIRIIVGITATFVLIVWRFVQFYVKQRELDRDQKKMNSESILLLSESINTINDDPESNHRKLVVEQAFFNIFGKLLDFNEIVFFIKRAPLSLIMDVIKCYDNLLIDPEQNKIAYKYPVVKIQFFYFPINIAFIANGLMFLSSLLLSAMFFVFMCIVFIQGDFLSVVIAFSSGVFFTYGAVYMVNDIALMRRAIALSKNYNERLRK